MATHADNKHYGISIVDSPVSINNLNNVDGVNPDSILDLLPVAHDISDQCDGQTKEFVIAPAVKVGTEEFFTLFLDGVRLTRANQSGQDDYFLFTDNVRFNLGDGLIPPPQGSSLIAIYTEGGLL